MIEEYIDGFGIGTKCVIEGIIRLLENKGVFDIRVNGEHVLFREEIVKEAASIYRESVDQLKKYTVEELEEKVYKDRTGFVVIRNDE